MNYLLFFLCVKISALMVQNSEFSQKQHEISSFSPFWLNLQEVHNQTALTKFL